MQIIDYSWAFTHILFVYCSFCLFTVCHAWVSILYYLFIFSSRLSDHPIGNGNIFGRKILLLHSSFNLTLERNELKTTGNMVSFCCPMCNKVFTAKTNLTRHVKNQHNNTWTCSTCNSTYDREDNFRYHQRNCSFRCTGKRPSTDQIGAGSSNRPRYAVSKRYFLLAIWLFWLIWLDWIDMIGWLVWMIGLDWIGLDIP